MDHFAVSFTDEGRIIGWSATTFFHIFLSLLTPPRQFRPIFFCGIKREENAVTLLFPSLNYGVIFSPARVSRQLSKANANTSEVTSFHLPGRERQTAIDLLPSAD